MHFSVRARANVLDTFEPPLGGFNEGCRARDVAQRPQNNRKKNHRGNAGVMPEAKG
jgi:hypothetical protein